MPFLTEYQRDDDSNRMTKYYWVCPRCGLKIEHWRADRDTIKFTLHLLEHLVAPGADLTYKVIKLDDICLACGLHKNEHVGPDGPHPDKCREKLARMQQ